jgi:Na+/H+ antiporter NhaD/arsenite permease-like protein
MRAGFGEGRVSDLMIATIIFVVTYAVIISERLNRTTVALAGGAAMIAFGALDQKASVGAIDPNTIALLVGMMIIVNVLRQTGIFRFAAWGTAVALRGDPWRMMVGFALFTAGASALLDNVTTILLVAPVTIALSDDLGLDPRPFLITQVIASNIGGTATLIGDPPNILIGGATGLDFIAFLTNLGPVVLILLPLMIGGFWLVYGRNGRLGAPAPESRHALAEADITAHLGDPRLLRISLLVLALTILGFFLHGALHYQAGTIAVFGAVTLLLLTRIDPHDVLAEVEWSTIFFFIGLFIVVGGIESVGLMEQVARVVIGLVGGNAALAAIGLLWFAGIASAMVDNIPAVATLIPLTFSMSRLLFPELASLDDMALAAHPAVTPLWWSLALGACLGGNGTLVGASANVVAVGIAERRGDHIGFWGFTRVGLPFALMSLVVSTVYVWVRYLGVW